MPNVADGAIPDDPRRIEKVKLRLSSELKNRGKSAMKDTVTGFTPTDEQILLSEVYGLSVLPSAVSHATPTVQNQSVEGSCMAFVLGYYMFSIEYYYKTGASSFNNAVNVFSPEYLFNYTALNGCTGSTALASLDLLKNKGICLWATLPYTAGTCNVSDASPHDAEAANYRIQSYTLNILSDRTLIKGLLAQRRPIYIGIRVDSAFYAANSSFIWNATNHAGTTFIGSHAVTIVGYDDTKSAYKIVNQWGTSWGDNGFSWIDYDFFETGGQCGYYGITIEGLITSAGTATLPFASAGFDTSIPTTGTGILDATASYDPNGYIASYLWTQISGATVTINNDTSAVANVTTWAGAGDYEFQVQVTDNDGNVAYDTVKITVVTVAAPADSIVLSGVKAVKKGKVSDVLTWQVALAQQPQSGLLQISATSGAGFNPLFLLQPFVPSGTYTNVPSNSKKFRYYRLQILKSDNTYAYSNEVALK